MFWADEIAAGASGPQVINDSKTPSGTVHVGSLRGPVLWDVVWRALRQRGVEARYLYGVDDLDPMDSQALLTPDAVDRYMGVPLSAVPAPAGSAATNYARHFVGELFLSTFKPLGLDPELYWMSELYAAGTMDPFIRTALDAAATVREIYLRVSKVEKTDDRLPISVICQTCGRIGTTHATDWDSETVAYACRPDMVTWATGCGASGRVAPFGGLAKLPFNVDWAAKWSHFGVTIEGCGKDLATAGGSRDRSDAIAREVFHREPPLNIPHEFINVGGKKMSTSRAHGAAAHEIAAVVPPEQIRLLLVRHRPQQAIEFNPDQTDAIPRLFDESDRLAAATAGRPVRGELPADADRIFAASLADAAADPAVAAETFRPAFAHLAMLVQIPGIDVAERAAAEKGSALTPAEDAILAERIGAARAWLATYAPETARIAVLDRAAEPAADSAMRDLLAALADSLAIAPSPWTGDQVQGAIFTAATERGIPAGSVFAALYAAFLGRTSGPRAGWLLASLDPAFVVGRLRQAAGSPSA